MSLLTTPRRPHLRTWATVAAGAITAGALAAIPLSPAQAAAPAGLTLQWNVNSTFQSKLGSKTAAAGAVIDAGNTYWTGGTVTLAPDGTTTASYRGTVSAKRSSTISSSEAYSITISDPVVTIGNDGTGSMTAVVGSTLLKNGAASTAKSPARVTVASFTSASSVSAGVKSVVGSPSTFDSAFRSQVVKGGFFTELLNSFPGDYNNTAATFIAKVPGPPAVTYSRSSTAGALAVAVKGTGFVSATEGVFVGVVPTTDLDTSTPATAEPIGLVHVPASALAAPLGSFSTTVTIARSGLERDTDYSLVTWTGTTAASRVTDNANLIYVAADDSDSTGGGTTTIVYSGAKTPPYIQVSPTPYGRRATAVVKVPEVNTGSVALTVRGKVMTMPVVNGSATFALGLLDTRSGGYQLKATYTEAAGHPIWFVKGDGSATLVITTTAPKIAAKVLKAPTSKKKGLARVTVTGVPGLAKANGRVVVGLTKTTTKVVKVKGKKVKKKVTTSGKGIGWAKNGVATVTLPRLKKGSWKMTATFYGDSHYSGAMAAAKPVKVRK